MKSSQQQVASSQDDAGARRGVGGPLLRCAAVLLGLLILTAACSTTEDLEPNDVVSAVAWQVPDTATYRVLDDDDEIGIMELSIEAEGSDALQFRQYFDFPDRGFTNEAIVVTDAELQPASADFRVEGPDGELTCAAVYADGEVQVHRVGEDGERDDTKDVPDIIYDSWSDLFVWRTIDFSEDYDEKYADSLSCTLDRTQVINTELRVKGIEEVEVAAGTFEAWRLEIKSGGATQNAWFTTDDERRLVKYDNGNLVFELMPAE